ncbi:AbiH family protein [Aquimarina sp. AU474]|uniref:AbiH family protein n=1 Tax=Aquimarina sp. AU474 TaxID=2108529 RepID=UPI000D69D1B8|nr:AbiH family protein [Aquimarina sp. AU474]
MYKTKNLIVLIGNGFDLAHGLKTSYTHFADYYIDSIVSPELVNALRYRRSDLEMFNSQHLSSLFDNSMRPDNSVAFLKTYVNNDNWDHFNKSIHNHKISLNGFLTNKLLGTLYGSINDNWFNVEKVYFRELLKIPKKYSINEEARISEDALILNSELNHIKQELGNYLNTLKIKPKQDIRAFLDTNVSNKAGLNNAYVVNFNYTPTLNNYELYKDQKLEFKVNHIHGTLNNEIIFGYGDDQSEEYKMLRDLEIDELLDGFKTYDYAKTNNYLNIQSHAIDYYLEYDVLVLGHSLGMTDKTLLEEILNSEKCKRIHIPKRGDLQDNLEDQYRSFISIYKSASRIISNDKRLRNLVVNFDDTVVFP